MTDKSVSPRPRAQRDRSATTREGLIQVARELFAEHGYAGVGTETIVRQAGLTRGALYHQFTDKADLFAAVVETVEAEVTGRVDQRVAGSGQSDPIVLMKLGADAWLDVCADPAASRILLLDAPAVLGWERWREIGLRYGLGMVQELIGHAITAGRIPDQPLAPLAHILIGALDEAALFVVRQDDQAVAREQVRVVLARLIDGLAAD